jgi:hypothetical protein
MWNLSENEYEARRARVTVPRPKSCRNESRNRRSVQGDILVEGEPPGPLRLPACVDTGSPLLNTLLR